MGPLGGEPPGTLERVVAALLPTGLPTAVPTTRRTGAGGEGRWRQTSPSAKLGVTETYKWTVKQDDVRAQPPPKPQ
jgi:hypothetical protein